MIAILRALNKLSYNNILLVENLHNVFVIETNSEPIKAFFINERKTLLNISKGVIEMVVNAGTGKDITKALNELISDDEIYNIKVADYGL